MFLPNTVFSTFYYCLLVNHIPGLTGIPELNQLHTQVFARLNKKLDPPEKIVVSETIQQVILKDIIIQLVTNIWVVYFVF